MKYLADKRWARVLSLVLLVVFLMLFAVSAGVVRYGRGDSWYYLDTEDFADTSAAREYVYSGIDWVVQNLRWSENLYQTDLGGYAGSAFAYRIITDGETTADTTGPDSVYIGSMDAGSLPNRFGKLSAVEVEGYINFPVEPYSGCYTEYLLFSFLFHLRYVFMALRVLSLIAAAVLLAFSAYAAFREGRAGTLRTFRLWPYDIVLCCAVVGYLLLGWLTSTLAEALMRLVGDFTNTWNYRFYEAASDALASLWPCAAAAFLVWYAAGQLGARVLWQRLAVLSRVPSTLIILAALALNAAPVFVLMGVGYSENIILLVFVVDMGIAAFLLWGSAQAKRVREAAEAITGGDLAYKTDTKKLHFIWRRLGNCLNNIGDGMAQAVEGQMRSERMKTELITNVSHDLKTPLTSIINYVALLKEPTLDAETRAEYLEILDRQSQRLKKLTEDVIEASKAASGVIQIQAEPIDLKELVSQVMGEYADRFSAARIEPILQTPEDELVISADSVLLGRVLDNIIGNIVKYAQPDTRAYIDLRRGEGALTLTAKNISHAPLNISAEELMERFVRGDSSRHTEGSGLGLSIARSLTELMGGSLRLALDGDLFKVILSFPA